MDLYSKFPLYAHTEGDNDFSFRAMIHMEWITPAGENRKSHELFPPASLGTTDNRWDFVRLLKEYLAYLATDSTVKVLSVTVKQNGKTLYEFVP